MGQCLKGKACTGTLSRGARLDGIILVMARSLPAKVENTPPEPTAWEAALVQALADGATIPQLAKRLAPHDKVKRKKLRSKMRYALTKPWVQELMGIQAKTNLVAGVGPASNALVRKAAAGRVDAMKLLFEASGFHNPRTEVNHSGEVQITIKGLPRPERVEDDATVVDAEVVD